MSAYSATFGRVSSSVLPFLEDSAVVVWHADKPQYQNQMAKRMAEMIAFFAPDSALAWYKAFMTCMMKHWNTIDHYRHNKFLYLIRTHFHGMLEYLKTHETKEVNFAG